MLVTIFANSQIYASLLNLKTVYVKKPGLQPGVNGALFCYCDFYRLQRVASICSQ